MHESVTTEQAGEQMPMSVRLRTKGDRMEVLPEAHGRSSKQREPSETCTKEAMENGGGEASGLRSDNTSSSTTRDPLSLHISLLFIASRREAFTSLTTHLTNLTT